MNQRTISLPALARSYGVRLVPTLTTHLQKARCPFHEERTPSFYVDTAANTFRCISCGASGDALAFVMRKEGKTFPEAVEHLASLAQQDQGGANA